MSGSHVAAPVRSLTITVERSSLPRSHLNTPERRRVGRLRAGRSRRRVPRPAGTARPARRLARAARPRAARREPVSRATGRTPGRWLAASSAQPSTSTSGPSAGSQDRCRSTTPPRAGSRSRSRAGDAGWRSRSADAAPAQARQERAVARPPQPDAGERQDQHADADPADDRAAGVFRDRQVLVEAVQEAEQRRTGINDLEHARGRRIEIDVDDARRPPSARGAPRAPTVTGQPSSCGNRTAAGCALPSSAVAALAR